MPHSPIDNQDTEGQSQDIRIEMPTGPITRARAKRLQEQVNLILNEYNNLFSENFILPKSSVLFVLRYVDAHSGYVLPEDGAGGDTYKDAHTKKQREGGVEAELLCAPEKE